jgi:hypothetical protein
MDSRTARGRGFIREKVGYLVDVTLRLQDHLAAHQEVDAVVREPMLILVDGAAWCLDATRVDVTGEAISHVSESTLGHGCLD